MHACGLLAEGWCLLRAVYLDGKRLQMANGETEQEHILALESGELMLLWQLHRPDMGNAVEITSGAMHWHAMPHSMHTKAMTAHS
jgi:hypothetical protein